MTENTPDPGVIPDEVVLPPPPTEVPQDVPGDKPDEDAPKEAEQAETTEEEVEEEPEQPRKSSGYARLKARHQATIAENEQLRRQLQQPPPPPAEREPKVEDFNGDYLAFEKAAVAFEARRTIREELANIEQRSRQAKQVEQQQETLQDFFERTEEIKAKIPDYDKAIDTLYGQVGALTPTLRDMIAKSDKGPLILYQLAKNPGFARDLQVYGPLDQAQEIGKLEERLSMPRNQTSAPPPIKSPKGGAAPPRDIFAVAAKSDDITDYVRARKAMKD